MEWRDEGLVIGVRRHGEHSAIVEAMTRAHGRHLGLVRGGRSARLNAALQPGNTLGLVWRARLDEHLGHFAVEPLSLRAGRLIGSAMALAGVNYLGALARLLPERDPHEAVYEALTVIVERSTTRRSPRRWWRGSRRRFWPNAASGSILAAARRPARARASPMSRRGRAGRSALEAGAPWRDRLLPLPAFLREGAASRPVPAPTRSPTVFG